MVVNKESNPFGIVIGVPHGIFAGAILGAISGWVVKRFYVQGQIDEVVFKDKELKK